MQRFRLTKLEEVYQATLLKRELSVTLLDRFQGLTIVKKNCISDVEGILDPTLILNYGKKLTLRSVPGK